MNRTHNLLASLPEIPFTRVLTAAGIVLLVTLVLHGVFANATRCKREVLFHRGPFAVLVYVAFGMITAILAFTAFGSILMNGKMEHQALLLHVMAAGAFTAIMVAFAYVWNPAYGRSSEAAQDSTEKTSNGWWVARWSLWLVLLMSLGVAASMVFGMLPLFDSQQMNMAIVFHRYCGLMLVIGLVVHLYAITIQRLGWR